MLCLWNSEDKNISMFPFPLEMPALVEHGKKFVNRWDLQSISVIFMKHFESKYIIKGRGRTLNWKFNPVHTIHSTEAMKRPSVLCFLISPRREPKKEEYFEKELREGKIVMDYE